MGRGRTAISPMAFIEAWKTLNYTEIHKAALKEASRQVNEMVKWMDWQIANAPEVDREMYLEVFGIIRKARNYRTVIYNRTRTIKESEFEKIRAELEGDMSALKTWADQKAEWEDDQHVAFLRIMKIYCAVRATVGRMDVMDPEDVEYEYDPEDS